MSLIVTTGTEPVAGFAKVLLGTPRRWGQIAQQAWGFEHPFPKLSDRDVTGLPDEPRQPWVPAWQFVNAETIPALRALCLQSSQERVSSWPSDCENEGELLSLFAFPGSRTARYWRGTTGTWVPDSPVGYGDTVWCRSAALSYAGNAIISSVGADWEAEPSLQWLVWRWAPAYDVTDRPYVALTVGGSRGILIRLPLYDSGDDPPSRPQVLHTYSGELVARPVVEFDSAKARSSGADATPSLTVVELRSIEPGVYVVSLSGVEQEALILEDDIVLAASPLTVTSVGAPVCFTVWPLNFPLIGTAEKIIPQAWPLWSNPSDGVITTRTYLPANTTVTSNQQLLNEGSEDWDDPPTTQPLMSLTTTDKYHTPILYVVTEHHPATWLAAEQATVDISADWERLELDEDLDGKGSSVTFDPSLADTLPDVGTNEWVEVTLGHMWSGTTKAEDEALAALVFSGWLEVTEQGRDGSQNLGEPFMSPRAYPWTRRWEADDGPRKWATRFAGMSFADWLLKDALDLWLISSGVPEELITYTTTDPDLMTTLKLPCARKWERRFAYGLEDSLVKVLDDLTLACGFRWRITRAGEVDFYQPVPWSGIPDWSITDGSSDAVDLVESIKCEKAQGPRRNFGLHIGADKAGSVVTGVVVDWHSLFNQESRDYLGDDWWFVKQDPALIDPEVTALAELERRRRYRTRVEWTWAGHPTWEPGHKVEINVSGIDVPTGSIVEILAKRSVVERREMRYQETITAGVVEVPEV